MEASSPSKRDRTVPTSDQNAPRINRLASGDASRRRLVPRKPGGQMKSTVSLTLKMKVAGEFDVTGRLFPRIYKVDKG